MKRFTKTFALLVVSLLLLVSGVDAALDHSAADPVQSSFTLYNQKGETLLAYNGRLMLCHEFIHPFRAAARVFQPRPSLVRRA